MPNSREPLTSGRALRPCLFCGKETVWGFDMPEMESASVCLTCNDRPDLRDDDGRVRRHILEDKLARLSA